MSQTMYPANCVYFATDTILPEAGDLLAAAWARGIAGNTGWLAYQWQLLGNLRGATEVAGYAYLTAGSYSILAYADGSQTVEFDGSEVISASSGTGMIAWSGTTGWYPITTDAGVGEYASLWLRRV